MGTSDDAREHDISCVRLTYHELRTILQGSVRATKAFIERGMLKEAQEMLDSMESLLKRK